MGLCWADNRDYRFACRPCWNKKVSWFHLSSREDVLFFQLRRKSSLGIYHIVVSADVFAISFANRGMMSRFDSMLVTKRAF